ncbi:MAG: 4-hydroxy-tetrahydrodipicolinate synthase [Prolixibacteraceae bacterium]|nr:4-hydroxy-tetrahydrodipicolinate synthase [Prolixibacteraceae bacterium]MBN2649138.1 4-hydroxy-tetrahydrodipicolinate synthase [Prolixibacteraceae bacterium]
MENILKGTGPALVTPFKKDLSVDYDALEKVLEYVIQGGVDFLVALGTTAETATLSHEERHEVYRYIKKVNNKRLPLVVGFGGNNTAEIIDHIKKADFEDVNAILSVVPYYNKPNQEGLYRHFMAIAEACPVPIILYNVPSRTGVNMTAETTLRLAKASDKFIGIKEASGDIEQVKTIIKNAPKDFLVLSGEDGLINEIASHGGHGVISVLANAFPKRTVELTNKSIEDAQAAKSLQDDFAELIKLLFIEGNPAGVKAALTQKGLIENVLRLPLCPVSDDTYQKISLVMDEQ